MRLNLQNDSMDNEEPMKMSIRFLQEITDHFSQERILGSGSFGTVYKGVTKNGDVMAVKLLHSMPGIDDEQFGREFKNLTELNHPNIVQLLGYCDETEEVAVEYNGKLITALKVHRALCLEYMPNGSLEKYLFDVDQGFGWPIRYKIIKGICGGLKYLHTGEKNPIYHLDLKPANILLDRNMVPRIADFGLSRLLGEENTTRTIWDAFGTLGYVPPEYISHQIISEGFDIFSLGVIIMNIVTGPAGYSLACDMEPAKVIEHACKKWRERLQVVQGYTLLETECQQVRKCIEIALKCIDANRRRRPPMRYIVSQLTEIEKQSNDTPSGIEVDQKFDDQESSLPNNNFQGQHSPDLQTAASGSQTQNLTEMASSTSMDKISLSTLPKNLPLEFLKEITHGFSEERILSTSAFGINYKGVLRNEQVISVKRFQNYTKVHADQQFISELLNIMAIEHENILKLLSYCSEAQKKVVLHNNKYIIADTTECILCYEYASKGSIEKYIFDDGKSRIDLCTRFKIIKGICQGLHFIHKGMATPIVHLDLIPANILLDDNMVAKITNFGLSRLLGHEQTRINTINVVGARGYMAPEYLYRGEISLQCDIYSLGLLIIEISTGENNSNEEDISARSFIGTTSEGNGSRATISEKKEEILKRMDHFPLFGRDSQTDELQKYLMKALFSRLGVMSVWGTNGVGKSASVRYLYFRRLQDDQQLFEKYGWVDVSHPFNIRDFSRTLLWEFNSDSLETTADAMEECRKIMTRHRCLVVIDGLHSKEEWDMIQDTLVSRPRSVIIVITTEVSIALHCAGTEDYVFNIKCLEDDAAFDLLKKEVRAKNGISTINAVSDNSELRKLISRCGGLPKVIVATARLLATDADKWENIAGSMNAQFMHYLETKQEFASLHDLFGWMQSYFRALPDDLRQSISYLSLFPGRCTIRRRRLVMRWVAEGYSKDDDSYTAGENGEKLFSKLVELSMIQPPRLTNTRLVSYQVSEFFREYIISRPVEENITIALEIFALKGHCHPTSQRRGRHLVIEESWHRDRIVFENIDFSRLRSLTVLGEWESFFISKSMKVLRVLDLEDASGVTDKDVQKMLELLPRLKFLSLRGCSEVAHLPSSLGDLRQLQILDVRGTSIVSMPASITKLKKLQYIRAGTTSTTEHPSTPCTVVSSWLSKLFGLGQLAGVKVPAGIKTMTLLHTLGVINVGAAGGEAILKELRNLTHLRKLGVSGISKRNSKEFCSAISFHVHLESLSLWLGKGGQDWCLDDISSPPDNLRSLKLYGLVKELPAWTKDLPKLTKLDLDMTISETKDIIAVLGNMKQLHTLRVSVKPHQDGGHVKLDFFIDLYGGVEMQCYTKVKVLHIACRSKLCVTFGLEAMQNLELLVVGCCSESELQFKELKRLPQLKEVQVLVSSDNTLKGFRALEKDLEVLQNDLKTETLKNLDSQLNLKQFRLRGSRDNTLKDLETLKKDLETLQKNLHSQLKLKEVRLMGSQDNTLRDLETLKKDLEIGTLKKDLETTPLRKKLETLKEKLMKLETLEKNLEALKKKNIETLERNFEDELMDHPRSPAVNLEYLDQN